MDKNIFNPTNPTIGMEVKSSITERCAEYSCNITHCFFGKIVKVNKKSFIVEFTRCETWIDGGLVDEMEFAGKAKFDFCKQLIISNLYKNAMYGNIIM